MQPSWRRVVGTIGCSVLIVLIFAIPDVQSGERPFAFLPFSIGVGVLLGIMGCLTWPAFEIAAQHWHEVRSDNR